MLITQTNSPCAAVAEMRWSAFLRIACEIGAIAAIGSLIWKPILGTSPIAPITIDGFRKDFNSRVTRCRGTPAQPGLVLGLEPDRNSIAHAVLLQVAPDAAATVWSEFGKRELVDVDYVPVLVAARRRDTGVVVPAVAVLVDTRSAAYEDGKLDDLQAVIATASGNCGTNLEYAKRSLAADRALHGMLPPHLAAMKRFWCTTVRGSADRSCLG